ARDARAALAVGIGAQIVRALVHDEGTSAGTEQRGRSRFKVDTLDAGLQVASARGIHGDVWEVARVGPPRVRRAVLALGRVEVAPGRLERGWIALALLVDVHSLDAGREAGDVHQNADLPAVLKEHGAPHRAPGRIRELCGGRRRRRRYRRDVRQSTPG